MLEELIRRNFAETTIRSFADDGRFPAFCAQALLILGLEGSRHGYSPYGFQSPDQLVGVEEGEKVGATGIEFYAAREQEV